MSEFLSGTLQSHLSENMTHKARNNNIYDRLYVNDVIDGLESLKTQFDLFISADVLIYIDDLTALFSSVKKHSVNNLLFIFSTEHTDGKGYILQETDRYAHSKNYILSVAAGSEFYLEYFAKTKLRKENNNWIIGGVYVLKRRGYIDFRIYPVGAALIYSNQRKIDLSGLSQINFHPARRFIIQAPG